MQDLSWNEAIQAMPSAATATSLRNMAEGHQRFRSGNPKSTRYSQTVLQMIATHQNPTAAVVGCSDSRVAPEIIFDQPLGGIFASRVPGNVASDSAKWMLEMAVTELRVPLVMVLGHTGCRAVGELVNGKVGGPGGSLRLDIQKAVHRAKMNGASDQYRQAVIENVKVTIENLHRESNAVQSAIRRGEVGLLGAYYEMETGEVHLIR